MVLPQKDDFLGIREILVLLSQDSCGALVQYVCSSCTQISRFHPALIRYMAKHFRIIIIIIMIIIKKALLSFRKRLFFYNFMEVSL